MSDSASGAIQRAELRRSARKASKGVRSSKSFSMMVHAYWQSEQYAKLSPRAVKLLVDLLAQYRGNNNGDLTTAWSVMQKRGWHSKDLLSKAQHELEARGWILRTRQGGRNAATLYAITFEGIDDCRNPKGYSKFDTGIRPDSMPLHLWKQPEYDSPAPTAKRAIRKKILGPIAGEPFPDSRANVVALKQELTR